MKKLLLVVIVISLIFGSVMLFTSTESNINPFDNKPAVVVKNVIECSECRGDGLIDVESKSVYCPACNGQGYLSSEGITLSPDYVRGYRDREAGKGLDHTPFLLPSRNKKWKEGWTDANEDIQ